jgi:8-oxo-dGTP diphosphatase
MPFYDHPRAAVTADIVLFAGPDEDRRVLLVCRAFDPFAGSWALPGGFVDEGERVEDAARRELAEETGVAWGGPLHMVGGYGDPGRDPRGWTISVVFTEWVGEVSLRAVGGDDAAEAAWHALDALPDLAFDHGAVVADAVALLRLRAEW